jgi:class 3 adenylate cyclase
MPRARTVTILFTDLVGSTELLTRVGDEHAQTIFALHRRILGEAVRAHGGQEIKWLGDGLLVAFDSASDAARCAVAMQRAARWPAGGERLAIRVGLHTGEVIEQDDDFFGTGVVIARRLCDRAADGQIFASETVARLVEARREFAFRRLDDLALKGIGERVPAVELTYAPDIMAMLRHTPFVGRDEQLRALDRIIAHAREGTGGVALVAGEPGIGKTRLVEEACARAEDADRAAELAGQALAAAAPMGAEGIARPARELLSAIGRPIPAH